MIDLLITGGTLDKQYDELTGELTFPETHLPLMLKQANCTLDITPQVLMQKDSLEMTDSDRECIKQACLNSKHSRIVITHGTDTMVETAKVLQSSLALDNKCIVLTGAMRPYRLGESDALFNLGTSLMAAQLGSNGIWISMNGKLFAADNVEKNRSLGQFEAL